MLYLMMNKCDNKCLIKVGFSDGPNNLKTRRKSYYGYNPTAIMRSTCAGGRNEEIWCRTVLAEWGGVRITGTEWFVISSDLFDKLYKNGMGLLKPKHQPIHFLEEF